MYLYFDCLGTSNDKVTFSFDDNDLFIDGFYNWNMS